MLERWIRFVLRHRVAVAGVWLALLGLGIWAGISLPDRLRTSLAVPGTQSERAQDLLARHFGERPDGTFTVVFRVRSPEDPALQRRLARRLEQAADAVPSGHATELRRGAGILYGDIATPLRLEQAKRFTDDLRHALRAAGGPAGTVTGPPAIEHDLDPILASDLRLGEAVAGPIALLVVIAVLGLCLAAGIPFVVAAGTTAASLAAVYPLARVVTVPTFVPNVIGLLALGLAVDYSLLLVFRFREEIERGGTRADAIVRTTATAGRAVLFSGVAVAIGLALLLLMPIPFIRGLGLAGLIVPLASVAATLTLQPVLLSIAGPRPGARRAHSDAWARVARAVMRRPAAVAASATLVLCAAAVPALFLHLTPNSIATLPGSGEAVRGYELVRDRAGPGIVTPVEVVVDAGAPEAARSGPARAAVSRLTDRIAEVPEAYVIASGRAPPYVDPSGRYARIFVAGRHVFGDPATRRLVTEIRERSVPAAGFPASARVAVGGVPAQGADFVDRTYGSFPWLVAAVLGLTFVALMRAFGSIVLPLKAIVLNLLTVGAVYGLLVVVFRWGVGAGLLGLQQTDQVEAWVPVFLFAVLFGLSMDYEVFIVMRMREAWDELHDNAAAVERGLERTGRVVTAAAAIMIVAFSGFALGRVGGLQELGVGLALAVFVDATIVRALLVPAAMAILGRWNWWLPAPLAWAGGTRSPSPPERD